MGNWVEMVGEGASELRWGRGSGVRPFGKVISERRKWEDGRQHGFTWFSSRRPCRIRGGHLGKEAGSQRGLSWQGVSLEGPLPSVEICSPFLCSLFNSVPYPALATSLPGSP